MNGINRIFNGLWTVTTGVAEGLAIAAEGTLKGAFNAAGSLLEGTVEAAGGALSHGFEAAGKLVQGDVGGPSVRSDRPPDRSSAGGSPP